MAAGHGGQILVADSTAVLLSGVDLIDLGSRRLRDVPTPVGVFQVRVIHVNGHFVHGHFVITKSLRGRSGLLRCTVCWKRKRLLI
jgi:hypothetical protein